jgi:hypothetical protein
MWRVRGNQRLTRREFLALSASSTAAAFLASCSSPTGGNNDEATFFINPGDTRDRQLRRDY